MSIQYGGIQCVITKKLKPCKNVLKRVLSFLRDFTIKSIDPGTDTLMTPRVVKTASKPTGRRLS